MFDNFVQLEADEYWSRNRTCIALAIAFAALTWCVAASSYAATEERDEQPGYRQTPVVGRQTIYRTVVRLAVEGITKIPNAHRVCGHVLRDRPWLIGMLFGLEAIPVGGWFLLGRVERELKKPRRRMR
jgi:hypothetical protein